ncbi:type II secretion system protein [Tautonia marina]|uniref:type II secretion system protein n=1 Tax=Tautonia marina TaxID=2653855 RepID=UPI001260F78A|nr:prepilin-type N-terminal cleavage/methylation domain-containing protein [Tautonia marina]
MDIHHRPSFPRAGFTLIELSIVLVIIGLVAGGVLLGRDLIEAAETRSIMSQLERYEVAVSTFRTKYNCLPGDCPIATQLGLGPNGNGNKGIDAVWDYETDYATFRDIIDGGSYHVQYSAEASKFWVHLSTSGLIKESIQNCTAAPCTPGTHAPLLANGRGGIVAFTWNNQTLFRTGFSHVNGQAAFYGISALKPDQVISMFTKIGGTFPYYSGNNDFPLLLQQQKLKLLPQAGGGVASANINRTAQTTNEDGSSCGYRNGAYWDTSLNNNYSGYACNIFWRVDTM